MYHKFKPQIGKISYLRAMHYDHNHIEVCVGLPALVYAIVSSVVLFLY